MKVLVNLDHISEKSYVMDLGNGVSSSSLQAIMSEQDEKERISRIFERACSIQEVPADQRQEAERTSDLVIGKPAPESLESRYLRYYQLAE